MTQQWEYKRILQNVGREDPWDEKLQELDGWMADKGLDGWELVSYLAFPLAIHATAGGSAVQAMNYQEYERWVLNVVFKRPISG